MVQPCARVLPIDGSVAFPLAVPTAVRDKKAGVAEDEVQSPGEGPEG